MRTLNPRLNLRENRSQNQRIKPIATAVGAALIASLATACSTDTMNDASVAAKELTDGYDVVSTSNFGRDVVSSVGSNYAELHDGVYKTGDSNSSEVRPGEAHGGNSETKSGSKCADGKCGEGAYGEAGAADGAIDVVENQ